MEPRGSHQMHHIYTSGSFLPRLVIGQFYLCACCWLAGKFSSSSLIGWFQKCENFLDCYCRWQKFSFLKSVLKFYLQSPNQKMVLFQPSEYPQTFDLLKSLNIPSTDADGKTLLPNMQQLLEDHLEHTEDTHKFIVSWILLKYLSYLYCSWYRCFLRWLVCSSHIHRPDVPSTNMSEVFSL